MDIDSIPVVLSVTDAPDLRPLGPESGAEVFGEPLHPVIQRYVRGDVPTNLSLAFTVSAVRFVYSGADMVFLL